MKRKRLFSLSGFATILMAASLAVACGKEPEIDNGDVDSILFENGTQIGDGSQEFEFRGKAVLPEGTYLMKGWIYVCNGAELTIAPGTVIKGDKSTSAALIVEPGGKIHASGTADAPIVFTSAQSKGNRMPGDWGGIIICGLAQNNQKIMQIEGGPRTMHGGNDNMDNSGELQYCRIEYAGFPFAKDKEINGLTLGSVGAGTKIDHVMVSYCNDDSFEWFGGTVNCDHLVAYHGWDDDFDTDNGYSGNVQYCLSVRNPLIADTSKSNGFESDNDADGDSKMPMTAPHFSNITLVGPIGQNGFTFEDSTDGEKITGGDHFPNNGSALGVFQAAMHLRRNTRLNCENTLAIGWPVGIMIDNQRGDCRSVYSSASAVLKNIVIADSGIEGSDFNGVYKDEFMLDYDSKTTDPAQKSFSSTWFTSDASRRFCSSSELGLTSIYGLPAFIPAVNSGLSGIGAFSGPSDNWMAGWTEFDPDNANY